MKYGSIASKVEKKERFVGGENIIMKSSMGST